MLFDVLFDVFFDVLFDVLFEVDIFSSLFELPKVSSLLDVFYGLRHLFKKSAWYSIQ